MKWTALHYAIDQRQHEAVEWLLNHGAKISADEEQGTALHCAAEKGQDQSLFSNLGHSLENKDFRDYIWRKKQVCCFCNLIKIV